MKYTHPSQRGRRAHASRHWLHLCSPRKAVSGIALGLSCVAASFLIGIQSAGDVDSIGQTEAQEQSSAAPSGDIDGDGELSIADALIVLSVVQGYETPTHEQLLRDPNKDGALTVDDALRILRTLSLR